MKSSTEAVFIVNPQARRGKGILTAESLQRQMSQEISTRLLVTRCPGDAFRLAREVLDTARLVVACGGDGTAHEVARAMAGLPVPMGVLPAGTANDFVKSYRPATVAELASAPWFPADLGRVRLDDGSRHLFINSCGIGLTGRIAARVAAGRFITGQSRYAYALFRELLGYAAVKMHITLKTPQGAEVIDEPVFAFSVGNGMVEGGRFMIAPFARIEDGLLDVCIIRSIPPVSFLPLALKYMKGTQTEDSMIVYRKVSSVELVLPEPQVMHMDGEVYRDISGRLRIDVMPGALRLIGQRL
ncbi:diacylglycerol kinase family protein [Prosthecochloris sp. HL-130-GSB]|jgi:diacylglycerol kinase (ATP)|uniref:diacylglycerol/lipid kinase family protein n=1 Tax=Prosthecochloris sp. HL-130-GSB TaxID=1974213 RepID=UPI000A1C0B8B|nr:diacylglycerol kinase family protein [Prosthecochloris sp. HL-130-GSB]ARM31461.1 hypothetical protein B9H02_09310 [Prosthecochloris sp. HL-130-GSB]